MLAQASLGLLLFERREQESRAKLQNGEISHKLQLHEKAITVIYWTLISSRVFFFQRVDNVFQLIYYFTSVFVIIYLGLVILRWLWRPLCIAPRRWTSGPLEKRFKNSSGYFQPIRNVVEERFTLFGTITTSLFFGAAQSRPGLQSTAISFYFYSWCKLYTCWCILVQSRLIIVFII